MQRMPLKTVRRYGNLYQNNMRLHILTILKGCITTSGTHANCNNVKSTMGNKDLPFIETLLLRLNPIFTSNIFPVSMLHHYITYYNVQTQQYMNIFR